jgi:hypothetical protein
MDWLWFKGEGPGDIPAWAYRYLTVTLQVPAMELADLRAVQKAGYWRERPVTFIRIFSPLAAEDVVRVRDFISLDEHPEVIRYEGFWDKAGDSVTLERRGPPV